MNDIADTDLNTLADLRVSAARLAVDAVHVAREVDSGINRVLERIDAAVVERTAALASAEAAYEARTRQEGADCSSEARRVAQCQEDLADAQQARAVAGSAAAAHTPAAQRYTRETARLTSEGSGKLSQLAGRVEQYLNSSSASEPGVGASSSGPSNRGAGGPAGGPSAIPGAPDGYVLMPLTSVDTSDSAVTGSGNFTKGYSPEDLAWAHNALHEQILPALRAGKGADYFQQKDLEANRYGSRSLSDTYSGFFGDSAIKLEPGDNGRYKIANGYHRVWVAQQMGLSHVVVRLR